MRTASRPTVGQLLRLLGPVFLLTALGSLLIVYAVDRDAPFWLVLVAGSPMLAATLWMTRAMRHR